MRGCEFDRLSHGMCSRHETQHMPRLRLAPPCSHARSRVAVAELGVVRRHSTLIMKTTALAILLISLQGCSASKPLHAQRGQEHPSRRNTGKFPKPDPAFDAAADRLFASMGAPLIHEAKKTREKGYVLSPYAPERGYIDVRWIPSGSLIQCPFTGRTFRIP